MSRIVSDLLYRLICDETELVKGLKSAQAQAEASAKKFTETGKKLTLGLTVPIIGAGAAMIKLASDTGESLNAANVVFKESTEVIEEWGKNAAEQAGLTSAEFYQASAVIGAGLINAGASADTAADQTIELTKRAADMASIFNTNVNDALLALQSGLRGESEPLRRFAISLDEASVSARATAMGLVDAEGEVTAYGKSQARLALIMEQSARFQGDFVNTSGDLANGTRIVTARIKEQAAQMGEQLLPLVLKVVQSVGDLVDRFSDLTDEQRKGILIFGAVAAAIGPMLIGVGKAITAVNTLGTALKQLSATGVVPLNLALAGSAAAIAVIVAAIALISAEMAKAKKEAQAFSDAMSGAAELEAIQQVIKSKQKEIDYQRKLIEQNDALGARGKQAADAARAGLERMQKEYSQLVQNYNGKKLNIIATEEQNKAELALAEAERKRAEAATAAALARSTGDADAIAAAGEQLARADEELAKAEEIAKQRADAYGDYIVQLALIKDASKAANEEIAKDDKKIWQERTAYAQQFASQLSTIFGQITDNQSTELDQQYAAEKSRIEATISDEGEKEKAIADLDKKLAHDKAVIQRKQAIADKAASLFDIGLNTATAISKALTAGPIAGPILAAVIGGLAAAQAAAVLAKPLPEIPSFADGGSFIVPPGFDNDSFPLPAAMVQSGERVTVETPEQQSASREIHLHVGTLVADKAGLRELDRRLRDVQSTETARRG